MLVSSPLSFDKMIEKRLKADQKYMKHSWAAPAIAPDTKHPAGPYLSSYIWGSNTC